MSTPTADQESQPAAYQVQPGEQPYGLLTPLISSVTRHPWLVAVAFSLLFVLITTPGIRWGAPDTWHPDEIVIQVLKALDGEMQFDQENFDYPSLPKYVMYAAGRLVLALGYGNAEIIQAARFLSVLFGAGALMLAFALVRQAGGGLLGASVAALLVLTSSEIAHNARFAHNDLYLTFFVSLTALVSLQFWKTRARFWLYAAFACVGLAASSKYNGASLIIVPLALYLLGSGKQLWQNRLRTVETLFISFILAFLAFALGTPRALTWMAFYFKRMIPALLNHAAYAREPGSMIGLLGQWRVLAAALGLPVFILFLAAVLWAIYALVSHRRSIFTSAATPLAVVQDNLRPAIFVLLLAALAYDIPLMVSYNYPARFLLPLIPLLAAVSGLFIEALFSYTKINAGKLLPVLLASALVLTLTYSFLRIGSVILLFTNDARIPSSVYLQTLRPGTSIEYTLYPPTIPKIFASHHNYPIFFKKFPGQPLPTSPNFTFNSGEAGIEERKPDYLVIDSFTYARFGDAYICAQHQVECTFFDRLLKGETSYRLVKTFDYTLPAYLPQIKIDFVNPVIQVYERR